MVTATDLAWAAGVLDGEGCVTIKKRGAYYMLFVVVGQSGHVEPALLRKLADIFGGTVEPQKADLRDGAQRKPRWQWYVWSGRAEDALRAVLPYLVTKRAEAEVAIEYRERGMGRGNQAAAVSYYQRLRDMKR